MTPSQGQADIINISLPIRDQVADILRRRIITGEYKAGQNISERDICAGLNISTTPIKEALRMLATEGLVYTLPRKGTYVSDVIGTHVKGIIYLRSVVEGVGAHLGTLHISDADINTMSSLLEQSMELAGDNARVDEMAKANYNFHRLLSSASQNQYILQLIDTMASLNNSIRYLYLKKDRDEYKNAYNEHKAILEAVKARDPVRVEALTVQHVRRVGDKVLLDTEGQTLAAVAAAAPSVPES